MRLFLVDNGSLLVQAWRNLRRLAEALTAQTGHPIDATPLLHSNRIPAEDLAADEPKAVLWERAFRRALEAGETDFGLIPLFLGPSGAITQYIPERLTFLRETKGYTFDLQIAPFLFPGVEQEDGGLLGMLEDNIRHTIQAQGWQGKRPPVLLVDHGSPRPEVTFVRNYLAGQLRERLRGEVAWVGAAAMERREGEAYAFNDPLLEVALRQPTLAGQPVIIAMLFLAPGRHAGADGDVATICREAEAEVPQLQCQMTPLLGAHPGMVDLLASRVATLLS